MIHVNRDKVSVPESLDGPESKGGKERKDAIDHYTGPDKDESFTFSAYKGDDVKLALDRLFHGKCAYCESHYASIHPMDVEHWRPKGEVTRREGELIFKVMKPGYYWLAAEWTNLLPSCIDCNRQRRHHEFVPPEGDDLLIIDEHTLDTSPQDRDEALEVVKRGKKNLFPVKGDDYPRTPEAFEAKPDVPMLLNPCEDKPEKYLKYIEGAVVCPKEQLSDDEFEWDKAAQSIMIYGLNRSRLVYARQELLLEIKARIYTITKLMAFYDRFRDEQDMRFRANKEMARFVEDVIEHEMRLLRRRTLDTQPFALMARQIINKFIATLK
ncbi:hypothetical protein N9A94_03545 [Akkermansiaceae bacterium]|nr:hypothetical protein [Akkermansiaceae bacterium]